MPIRLAFAQATEEAGGEANLKLPDLSQVQFLGIDGHKLLLFGLLFCVFGLIFGLAIYSRLKQRVDSEALRLAMASKDDDHLLGDTEFWQCLNLRLA